jgi:membrane fusion protein, heavy metal efflux system
MAGTKLASFRSVFKWLMIATVVGVAGCFFLGGRGDPWIVRLRNQLSRRTADSDGVPSVKNPVRVGRVDARSDGIRFLSDDPGVPRITTAKPAQTGEPLQMLGTLFLEPDSLSRVHSRFPGEVVRVGQVDERGAEVAASTKASNPDGPASSSTPSGASFTRGLRLGDIVHKGQLLAVVWSKDVGEKKSELVDAVSRLNLSERVLQRLKQLEPGAVAMRAVNEAQRDFEADLVSVQRAERTLRSWRLTDEEIEAVRKEAQRLHQTQLEGALKDGDIPADALQAAFKGSAGIDEQWAQIEIRSPQDGVILERNFTEGQIIDTNDDLFKIGDPSNLRVMAYVYEEDLPFVRSLPPAHRVWHVDLKSDPHDKPFLAPFDVIGRLIDPQMHTGVIMGEIPNPDGHFAAGQFVTCVIDRESDPTLVMIPTSALIENGVSSAVFVQTNAERKEFELRNVRVARRGAAFTFVKNVVPVNPDPRAMVVSPLLEGDVVISSGVLEWAAALEDLKSTGRSGITPAENESNKPLEKPSEKRAE